MELSPMISQIQPVCPGRSIIRDIPSEASCSPRIGISVIIAEALLLIGFIAQFANVFIRTCFMDQNRFNRE
jgi:hypothetical protein